MQYYFHLGLIQTSQVKGIRDANDPRVLAVRSPIVMQLLRMNRLTASRVMALTVDEIHRFQRASLYELLHPF